MLDEVMFDIRYALRTMRRNPGFTLAAVSTLGLGIGANATIFSLVSAVLLRPPAEVREPDRLVHVFTSDYSGPRYGASSFADYLDYRDGAGGSRGVRAHSAQLQRGRRREPGLGRGGERRLFRGARRRSRARSRIRTGWRAHAARRARGRSEPFALAEHVRGGSRNRRTRSSGERIPVHGHRRRARALPRLHPRSAGGHLGAVRR